LFDRRVPAIELEAEENQTMRTRFFGRPVVIAAALAACAAGTALGATAHTSKAYVPAGEPVIPGATYFHGTGAPYLSTKGAPRALSGAGIGQYGGAAQALATKLGTTAGTATGKKVKLKQLKIGYLDIIGGIESADRVDNAMRTAAAHIGAKWLYCDGQGSPTQWVTCGNTLLSEGANIIVLTGIDPAGIASVVTAAKAKNVPIVDMGGLVQPGYATAIYPNEAYSGKILSQYLKAKLATQSGASQVMITAYPATWAVARTAQLKGLAHTATNIQIADVASTDPTNLIAGTQSQVSAELTADPSIRAIWADFDTAGQAVGQEVAKLFPGKSFPARPLVVTFHADPSTQTLMRSGSIDAVVDNNYDATAWELANAIAEHYARGAAWPAYNDALYYKGIGNPLEYEIVTSKNLPAANHYAAPQYDIDSYFIAKWKAEGFGK
jgi:ABC-type sugar transport system substrate-binding protein